MHKTCTAIITLIGSIYFFNACLPESSSLEQAEDPWVLRSILDQQPRMVSLELHDLAYAAYDLENCELYKVWRGGVHLNGAAFNNLKTVQPTTWGNSYWERDEKNSKWWIESEGKKFKVKPVFKGYALEKGKVQFNYEIILEKTGPLIISETPEFSVNGDGKIDFSRSFTTQNIPEHISVYIGEQKLVNNTTDIIEMSFDSVALADQNDYKATTEIGALFLDKSGCNTCHEEEKKTIGPSYNSIAESYNSESSIVDNLVSKVKYGGSGNWGSVPMTPHPHLDEANIKRMIRYILSLKAKDPSKKKRNKTFDVDNSQSKHPGFGAPLVDVHPSFDIQTIRPKSFEPRVTGMDFTNDGTLLICTWDSIGGVYALTNVNSDDIEEMQVRRIASGLAEPLGLKVVDDTIYVMQKNELSQLVDSNDDGIIDVYNSICNSFGVTADFHEYSYGLEYEDGYFYGTLGLAMRLMEHEFQHPDRGTVIKIKKDGSFTKIVNGLRQPNGIGRGVDGELFITENQGNWVPACKLIHVQEGDFHGCLSNSGDRFDDMIAVPPAVWLPQDEIGNSPGQPILIPDGTYAGQMLHGEVTHGGIKRVFLEKVNGQYQGCVFRFTQGMEAGINRLVWGPNGSLYAGGVGMAGNWGWEGKQFGLQRLKENGKSTFEILAIRANPEGFEIEFTEAISNEVGNKLGDYEIQQWRYEATENYGGPKLDLEKVKINKVTVSNDRKKVQLSMNDLKLEHVVYFYLGTQFVNEQGEKLWTGESWYTLNNIPTD